MTNYEEKYKVLRNSINNLAETYGKGSGADSILEIAQMTDKLEDEQPKQADKQAITKEDIMSIKNPSERIKLISENSNLFKGDK